MTGSDRAEDHVSTKNEDERDASSPLSESFIVFNTARLPMALQGARTGGGERVKSQRDLGAVMLNIAMAPGKV